MSVAWAIAPEKIDAAVERIVEVARPRNVILFGSAVRGEGASTAISTSWWLSKRRIGILSRKACE